MSYSETITKNDLKKVLENVGIGVVLETKVGIFTLSSGWTGDEIEVRQFGDVVMVKGYFTKSGGTGTNEIAIGNISGVSLPTSHVRFRVGAGNAAYNATLSGYGILAKSGQLSVKLPSSQTTVTVELTYISAHSTGGYKYLIDTLYPVGSCYETTDENFDPNNSWGGTWVKYATDLIERRKLMWTNNGATTFAAQTISMDLSNYTFAEVEFYASSNTDIFVPDRLKIRVGENGAVILMHNLKGNGTNENTGARKITVSASGVAFTDYTYKNRRTDGTLTVANQFCVPHRIYGIQQITEYRWHRTA